ncbi:MAG: hypothetical protein ONB46_00150 [candidate division KSB1 bacterium]|nr:hypothetical protein [candidate division KSB1 bacterium]MDZ7364746.1 hypothetical protein [candidate division KSB1 bacterium]MDZ7402506.1 hypothetical protein [candidate division KSB1 bacterium]
MKRIHSLRLMAIMLLVMSKMILLWGCSPDQHWAPTSPAADGRITALAKDDDDDDDDLEFLMVARRDPAENGVSTALIGPEGGVLHHAAHRLEVPAGALNEALELTFSMPLSDTLTFDMGPHGTQFNLPVSLVFYYGNADLAGVNEARLQVYYYDPSTQIFEAIPTVVDTVNKIVTGYTDHFSRYALIRK